MSLLNPFSLAKMTIKAYQERTRTAGWLDFLLGEPQTFEVMFNPESYSIDYSHLYQDQQGINTSGREAKYSLSQPKSLTLTFILDDSCATGGVLAGTSFLRDTISDRVEKFLDMTARIDGDIHEPRFLRLEWGNLIFDCRVEKATVKYTFFDRSGEPIRAEIAATFVEDIEDEKRALQDNLSSPDLTHTRTVTAGDNLPLMAYRIYRDSSYYVRVAQANQLNSLRNLKVGKSLKFPPIQKTKS